MVAGEVVTAGAAAGSVAPLRHDATLDEEQAEGGDGENEPIWNHEVRAVGPRHREPLVGHVIAVDAEDAVGREELAHAGIEHAVEAAVADEDAKARCGEKRRQIEGHHRVARDHCGNDRKQYEAEWTQFT